MTALLAKHSQIWSFLLLAVLAVERESGKRKHVASIIMFKQNVTRCAVISFNI